MEIPPISSEIQLAILVIVGIAGLAFTILTLRLESNLSYWVRRLIPGEEKRGNKPRPRAILTWILFFLTGGVSVVGAAIVAVAPTGDTIQRMTGEFNIAVASFSTPDGSKSDIGIEVAQVFSRRLETELNEYSQTSDSIKVFDVLHPSDAGFISAKTSVERAQQAISLAERVNAHIVIYGVVEEQGSNIIISPEFLVATKYIQDAEEILGQHRLGTPIDIADSAENLSSLISFNKKLTDRSSALASITLGLFSYFIRDYTSARQFFQQADSLSSWDASEGKEVLYILTGNTEAKDGDLESADLYYQKAIALNHEYARGYIGRATVTFRQAILDSNHVDYDKVSEAISFFNDGLSAKDQPSFSHIDFKAQFGLGEASLLLTQAGIENELDAAESHFQFVVNYFLDNPDDLLRERAAQAYAHLGLIAYIKNKDMSNVGKYYESAASLSIEHNPDLAAQYWKKLAALYLEQNDVNSAMIYIKKAIQTAEDPDEKDRLQMMLEAYTHPK